MKSQKIEFKGLGRVPGSMAANGIFDELINIRFEHGVHRPVRKKRVYPGQAKPIVLNVPGEQQYDKLWFHTIDTQKNLIGKRGSNIVYVLPDGSNDVIMTTSADAGVTFIKKFLLIVTKSGIYRFLWDGISYVKVDMQKILNSLSVYVDNYGNERATTDPTDDIDVLLGRYFQKLDELSADNFHHGGMMWRYALRMFDGSYIFASVPRYVQVSDLNTYLDMGAGGKLSWAFVASKLRVSASYNNPVNFDNIPFSTLTKVISSIVVFASKIEPLYDISEDTVTKDKVQEWFVDVNDTIPLSNPLFVMGDHMDVSKDFKELQDSPAWYKIAEIPLDGFTPNTYIPAILEKTDELDLTGYYQDYATRETLPVDQFSYVNIGAGTCHTYNARLLLGDIKSSWFTRTNPVSIAPGRIQHLSGTTYVTYDSQTQVDGVLSYQIETPAGMANVREELLLYQYTDITDLNNKIIIIPHSLGYIDARAKSVKILLRGVDADYILGTYSLTKSKYDNMAYLKEESFNPKNCDLLFEAHDTDYLLDEFAKTPTLQFKSIGNNYGYFFVQVPTTLTADGLPSTLVEYIDTNRVQGSELNNPFVFPARLSYQVGNERVIAIRDASDPTNEGQFGEYPLTIFCSDGTFALNQGSGDVIFASVTPLVGAVANNKNNIVGVGGAIVFTTDRGIFLLSGREVRDIGEAIYGPIDEGIRGNLYVQKFLEPLSFNYIFYKQSFIDFRDYLKDPETMIGYDREHNELLVTKPFSHYRYSYVYNFNSQSWYTITTSYDVLIRDYPRLLGVSAQEQFIVNISDEVSDPLQDANVECMFITQPIKMEGDGVWTILHRSVLRGYFNGSNVYNGFYVFLSDDMKTWQISTGRQLAGALRDMRLTRTHMKAKYYRFMFAGILAKDSYLDSIDVQYYPKLSNKLR